MKVKFFGKVTNGKLSDVTRLAVMNALPKFEGKVVFVKIEEREDNRSLSQNAFYWTAIVPIIKRLFIEAGNVVDDEEVHEYLKNEVGKLRRTIVLPNGEVKQIPGSTKKLTTKEFEDYLTTIRAWAADYGVAVPFPEMKGFNDA